MKTINPLHILYLIGIICFSSIASDADEPVQKKETESLQEIQGLLWYEKNKARECYVLTAKAEFIYIIFPDEQKLQEELNQLPLDPAELIDYLEKNPNVMNKIPLNLDDLFKERSTKYDVFKGKLVSIVGNLKLVKINPPQNKGVGKITQGFSHATQYYELSATKIQIIESITKPCLKSGKTKKKQTPKNTTQKNTTQKDRQYLHKQDEQRLVE